MKRNEIILLNGEEYTLELNRDSFLKLDQYTNFQKSNETINKNLYEYVDEIEDNEDPFANTITDEELDKAIEEKENTLKRMVVRAFWIWLYPNHKLKLSEVERLLKDKFEDSEKYEELVNLYSRLLKDCVEIKENYENERKNLKAQTNK